MQRLGSLLSAAVLLAVPFQRAAAQGTSMPVTTILHFDEDIAAYTAPTARHLGDIDADGADDFALLDFDAGGHLYTANTRLYSGTAAVPITLGALPDEHIDDILALGNIDGDPAGHGDILVLVRRLFDTSIVAIAGNSGAQLYSLYFPNLWNVQSITISHTKIHLAGDVDGDGHPDFAVTHWNLNFFEIFSGIDGASLAVLPVSLAGAHPIHVARVGDIAAGGGDELILQYDEPPFFNARAAVLAYDAGALQQLYPVGLPQTIGIRSNRCDASALDSYFGPVDLNADAIGDFVIAYPDDFDDRGSVHVIDGSNGQILYSEFGDLGENYGRYLFPMPDRLPGFFAIGPGLVINHPSPNTGVLHLKQALPMSAGGGFSGDDTVTFEGYFDSQGFGNLVDVGQIGNIASREVRGTGYSEIALTDGTGLRIVSISHNNTVGASTHLTGVSNYLTFVSDATVGGLVDVALSGAQPAASVEFWLGRYPKQPWHVGGVHAYIDPGAIVQISRGHTVDGSGRATYQFGIPNNPILAGKVWSVTAVISGYAGGTTVLDVSNGAQLTISP